MTPLRSRAELLEKLADLLEQDRFRLAALQTHEVGKPWREADADVAEAVDFCRYYARRLIPELGPANWATWREKTMSCCMRGAVRR
jgi:delta 1-pyrroline-5-carboxylate dehydrogenase